MYLVFLFLISYFFFLISYFFFALALGKAEADRVRRGWHRVEYIGSNGEGRKLYTLDVSFALIRE